MRFELLLGLWVLGFRVVKFRACGFGIEMIDYGEPARRL